MISIKNLSTKFGNHVVHNKLNLNIKQGEIYGLLGGSGSGKTTLLRQMIMLSKIHSGEINVLGYSLKNLKPKEAKELQKNWGVLFQFSALFTSLNIYENIAIVLQEYTNLPDFIIKDIVLTKIKMVGLDESVAYLYPSELSGGMKKRAGLARALALDPKLLFLDEPTSGLDPKSAREFDELIVKLRDLLDLSVIMVTHDKDTITNVLDRFILLGPGKVIMEGNFDDFRKNYPKEFKEFME